MQGLLEAIGIPYTGSGPARVHALHGQGARQAPDARGGHPDAGLPLAARGVDQGARRGRRRCATIERALGFPLVVKPASQGSALGVKFARASEELPGAMVGAFSYDRKVADRALRQGPRPGGVGARRRPDGEPLALPVVEAVPREEEFYDYESRYEIGMTTFVCPAELRRRDDRARAASWRSTSTGCSAATASRAWT